jgi:hypothetical protein
MQTWHQFTKLLIPSNWYVCVCSSWQRETENDLRRCLLIICWNLPYPGSSYKKKKIKFTHWGFASQHFTVFIPKIFEVNTTVWLNFRLTSKVQHH